MEWTKLYCGITHLKIPRPYQITVTQLRDDRFEVYMLNLNREVNEKVFTPIKEKYTKSISSAKTIGETWYKNIVGNN